MAVGGQAATSARIENYLGFPAGLSGAELAERAKLQAEKFNAQMMVPRRAIGLTEKDGFHAVALDNGDELIARSVILALGVQYASSRQKSALQFKNKTKMILPIGGKHAVGDAGRCSALVPWMSIR